MYWRARHGEPFLAPMAADRLRARLAQLPHDALLDICAYACSASEESRHAADARLSIYAPVPTWAVEEVLLSPDLMQDVMTTLSYHFGAAAAVCSVWRNAWRATAELRRKLFLHQKVELGQPGDFNLFTFGDMLCNHTSHGIHFSQLATFPVVDRTIALGPEVHTW